MVALGKNHSVNTNTVSLSFKLLYLRRKSTCKLDKPVTYVKYIFLLDNNVEDMNTMMGRDERNLNINSKSMHLSKTHQQKSDI